MKSVTIGMMRRIVMLGLAFGACTGIVLVGYTVWRNTRPASLLDRLPRSAAVRSDLHTSISAGGQIESVDKTLIECELEAVSFVTGGRVLTARNASTIIELIPEGSHVKEGDILCRLDASEYEELVVQQEIKLQESQAEHQRAVYDLKAAEVTLLEYREGTLAQRQQDIESRLTLAQSDIERQQERVKWAERMVENKYMSEGQLITEREFLLKSEIGLRRVLGEKRYLENYLSIATIARLESRVTNTKTELAFQEMRHRRRLEQMEKFKEQVDRCTIRAPHDGLVIYANEPDATVHIELGAEVHQKMDLFYLPNSDNMEVQTVLNESFMSKVASGMQTSVRVEALSGETLEGEVVYISPLPLPQKGSRAANDVKNFLAKVKLNNSPEGIMPGMTAEVEIETGHHPHALVIPSCAVKVEDGVEVCYVPTGDSLERRRVDVEPATLDMVEVKSGLKEGEEVISEPYKIDESIPVVDLGSGPDAKGTVSTSLVSHPVAWGSANR